MLRVGRTKAGQSPILSAWKAFPHNRDGNYAVIFALTLTTLLLAVGTGIDVVNSESVRRELQDAMDSAVLAAAAKGSPLDEPYAKQFFLSNVAGISAASDDESASGDWLTVHSVDFVAASDGSVVGTAHATVNTLLMSIAGISTVDLDIKAKASGSSEKKIEDATYQIKNAQGAYDKDIYFFTRDANGNIVDETLILKYDYKYAGGKGYKYYTPAKTSDITVKVGDYTSYGYKMVVYEDTTYTGKHINPKEYYSDDENAPDWTKVDGDCTDKGGSSNYWEDGGDANYQDFVFTMTCTEGTAGAKNVRLME